VTEKVEWVRPIFEGVVYAMKLATDKPFKVAMLGPAQQSIILHNEYYEDNVALARDIAVALNQELRYLVSQGLEAVQLIDVLPPYTNDPWQIEVQETMFDGVDATVFWHVCYGSGDGQRGVFEDKAVDMMPVFKESPADVIHLEFTNKGFGELEAFRDFPVDKVLGVGVVDAKNTQVETPEVIADRIRRALDVVPPFRPKRAMSAACWSLRGASHTSLSAVAPGSASAPMSRWPRLSSGRCVRSRTRWDRSRCWLTTPA
jgi:5-methyltetrahydropteroyltriglutamate--homocysteine methyltransferase